MHKNANIVFFLIQTVFGPSVFSYFFDFFVRISVLHY